MKTMSVQLPEGELTFEQDGQWITSDLPVPDPGWRTTDKQGHEHHYDGGPDRYPTLTAKLGEAYWCDSCRDEHQDAWYECRICGEQITPGTRTDTTPTWVGSPARYYLDGEPITQEQANELINKAWRARDDAARIRDRPPAGTLVRLCEETVTIAPTEEGTPDDQVTIMRHGTGTYETVRLDTLRTKQAGLG